MSQLVKFLVLCFVVCQISARSLPVESIEQTNEQNLEQATGSNEDLKDIDIDDLIQYIQSLPSSKLNSLLRANKFDDSQESSMSKRSQPLNHDNLNEEKEVDDLISYLMSLKSNELNSILKKIDLNQFDVQND